MAFGTIVLYLGVLAPAYPEPSLAAMKASGMNMQKPPDHEAAMRSEFENVQAANTAEAYERFIRRHPGHPLVGEARRANRDVAAPDGGAVKRCPKIFCFSRR